MKKYRRHNRQKRCMFEEKKVTGSLWPDFTVAASNTASSVEELSAAMERIHETLAEAGIHI